jgi:hypothetical protein
MLENIERDTVRPSVPAAPKKSLHRAVCNPKAAERDQRTPLNRIWLWREDSNLRPPDQQAHSPRREHRQATLPENSFRIASRTAVPSGAARRTCSIPERERSWLFNASSHVKPKLQSYNSLRALATSPEWSANLASGSGISGFLDVAPRIYSNAFLFPVRISFGFENHPGLPRVFIGPDADPSMTSHARRLISGVNEGDRSGYCLSRNALISLNSRPTRDRTSGG